MSQLGCVGSGNKLQRQMKGPWNVGERKQGYIHMGKERGKALGMLQGESTPENGVGKGTGL